jgi:hypothetical protein
VRNGHLLRPSSLLERDTSQRGPSLRRQDVEDLKGPDQPNVLAEFLDTDEIFSRSCSTPAVE